MTLVRASVPEPPPAPGESYVVPSLLARLAELNADPRVSELVRARESFGIQKYGQGLMTRDGRDAQEDLVQELADALQYAHKLSLEVKAAPGAPTDNVDLLVHLVSLLYDLIRDVQVALDSRRG